MPCRRRRAHETCPPRFSAAAAGLARRRTAPARSKAPRPTAAGRARDPGPARSLPGQDRCVQPPPAPPAGPFSGVVPGGACEHDDEFGIAGNAHRRTRRRVFQQDVAGRARRRPEAAMDGLARRALAPLIAHIAAPQRDALGGPAHRRQEALRETHRGRAAGRVGKSGCRPRRRCRNRRNRDRPPSRR